MTTDDAELRPFVIPGPQGAPVRLRAADRPAWGADVETLFGRPLDLSRFGRGDAVAAVFPTVAVGRGRALAAAAVETARGRLALVLEPGLLAHPTPLPAGRPLALSLVETPAAAGLDPRPVDAADRARAVAAIARLAELRLAVTAGWPTDRRMPSGRVLVLDEPQGSAAPGEPADAAAAMLRRVLAGRAAADVVVLACEEEMRGAGVGRISGLARRIGVAVAAGPIDPWTAIEGFDEVHALASAHGWIALALGKRLVCHGAADYAGRGLTEDVVPVTGRPRVDLADLWAERLFRRTRCLDPWTRTPIGFEDAVDKVAALAVRHGEFSAPAACFGISKWKRETIRRFFAGAPVEPTFSSPRRLPPGPGGERRSHVWSAKIDPAALATAPEARPVLIEDGFVRSVGLGAAGTPPLSLVFDRTGIYCDATRPSDLETILETHRFTDREIERAAAARRRIVAAGLSKYNVGGGAGPVIEAGGRRVLLVPGQVENDLSLRFGCTGRVRGNLDLLEAVRAAEPDAYVIFKPHPDVVHGYRRGRVPDAAARRLADRVIDDASISALLDRVDEIHTMTSLTGFEALLRGLKVTTWGTPFYAGWGLTRDMEPAPRRTRHLSLDELVAGTLLVYPRYLDPISGYMCNLEQLLDRFESKTSANRAAPAPSRITRAIWRIRGMIVPKFT